MNFSFDKVNQKRRSLLVALMAASLFSKMGFAASEINETAFTSRAQSFPKNKFALVIGNREYPNHTDLPSARKNVADMVEALNYLDFNVTSYTNLGTDEMRSVLTKFSQEMKLQAQQSGIDNTVVVFYFCGHGFQNKGENFLVPAGINPSSAGAGEKSIKLNEDIINRLHPNELNPSGAGLTLALIDACRTDLMVKHEVDESFNQIIVPDGTIVFFATRAGRPALAPVDEKRNTFFTGSLVEALQTANGVTPIDDVCQKVAINCRDHVSAEFKKVGLNFPPQFPEKFSGKLRNSYIISNKVIEHKNQELAESRKKIKSEAQNNIQAAQASEHFDLMNDAWEKIQVTILPKQLLKLCEDFKNKFPDSEHISSIEVIQEGAKQALAGYRVAGLASDSLIDPDGKNDKDYHLDLAGALKGDKDSAYRVALMYRDGSNGLIKDTNRAQLWLAFAAELGNGIASWKLSEMFSATGQEADQAKYEKLAKDLGYTPPARLSNRGY